MPTPWPSLATRTVNSVRFHDVQALVRAYLIVELQPLLEHLAADHHVGSPDARWGNGSPVPGRIADCEGDASGYHMNDPGVGFLLPSRDDTAPKKIGLRVACRTPLQFYKPARIGQNVVVGEDDEFPKGFLPGAVEGAVLAALGFGKDGEGKFRRVLAEDRGCAVGARIVNE